MATTTRYRPVVPTSRDGFGQLLLAEWTKLRSVRGWVLGLLAMVVLTLTLSLFTAAGSGSDANDHLDELGVVGPEGLWVKDEFHFVHQPLSGNGSVTARVRTQTGDGAPSHEWAKAGVMIKAGTGPGSPYAAMMVTPSHGVRLQANFTTDLAGSASPAPRWLRLTRSGAAITGYESADGATWSEVGRVHLDALPPTVEVGLFVTSPDRLEIHRSFGGAATDLVPTLSAATFDNARVEAAQPQPPAPWRDHDTSTGFAERSAFTEAGGIFTVAGSGDIAPNPPDEDVAQLSLLGILVGQIAVIAVSVLFITSEYKRGMIRTTLAASPRRGRVLAAKAIVIGGATLTVALVASLTAFALTQPVLRANGFGPPAYPIPSLADWPVLRAVVGAAVLLALVAVFSLGVGATLRQSAGAIAAVVVLLIPPIIIADGLPLAVAQWLIRSTPPAGLSILQTIERDHDTAVEAWGMAPPLAGLGVLAAYAAASLAVAYWRLGRRDA